MDFDKRSIENRTMMKIFWAGIYDEVNIQGILGKEYTSNSVLMDRKNGKYILSTFESFDS